MKCYYHPEKDAVGTCSQCGKAACRDCIEDVGGALLCKDCMAMAWQEMVAEKEEAVKEAKRSIMWSWIVTTIFSLCWISILILGLILEGDVSIGSIISIILLSLLGIYASWSMYWGWKVVWPWWIEFWNRIGCFLIASPVTWVIVTCLFFYIPLIGASMYALPFGNYATMPRLLYGQTNGERRKGNRIVTSIFIMRS